MIKRYRYKEVYKKIIVIGLLIVIIIINVPFKDKQNDMKTMDTEIKDEFKILELTYLGSARIKEKNAFLSELGDLLTYNDVTGEYTFSYKLIPTKEDYKNFKKEYGLYKEQFKIKDKHNKIIICSYGKKLQWLKYNPVWQMPSGGLVNRAGFEDMDLEDGVCFFYEFDFDPELNGYLADMLAEKRNPVDEFVNLDLTYIGSAKFTGGKLGMLTGFMYEENGLQYTYTGYMDVSGKDDFDLYVDLLGIYDMDFIFKTGEGKGYVFSYGRKMEWMQYNPARKSTEGGLMHRAGLDWTMEFEKATLFFYEFNYDYHINGFLADMEVDDF